MAILAYDDVMLREPRLLVPRMAPLGPVKIDWANPITNKLVGCWPLSSANDVRNLARPSSPPFVLTGAPPTDSDYLGKYINWENNDYGIYSTPTEINNWSELTVSILTKTNKDASFSSARVLEKGGNTEFGLIMYGWPTTEWWIAQLAATNVVTKTFTIDDAWHSNIMGITLSGTSGYVYAYRDGVYQGEGSATISSSTGDLHLNRFGGSAAYHANRGTRQLCIWRRVLTLGEIQAISNDPYQFLIPA